MSSFSVKAPVKTPVKALMFGWVVTALFACGAKPAPVSHEPVAKPDPAGSGSAAGGANACAAAGGTCTSATADVACKSQPPAGCGANEICCVL